MARLGLSWAVDDHIVLKRKLGGRGGEKKRRGR